MKMGSDGNGWKTPSPIFVGSHKYGNGRNKVENGTGRNWIFSSVFNANDSPIITSGCFQKEQKRGNDLGRLSLNELLIKLYLYIYTKIKDV